jgi:hypothetical protein
MCHFAAVTAAFAVTGAFTGRLLRSCFDQVERQERSVGGYDQPQSWTFQVLSTTYWFILMPVIPA